MAEGKKTILVYAEWREIFCSLNDDEAGRLIKHFFDYVNDLNPEPIDRLTEISFIQIKQQLKRDLQKWEQTIDGRSKAGKASAEARANKKEQTLTNSTNVKSVEKNPTNPTVKDKDKDKVLHKCNGYTYLEVEKLFLEKTLHNWNEAFAKKEAEKFFNFYASKNWMVGKNKMKSLPHAVGGWIARQEKPKLVEKEETDQEYKIRMLRERGFAI
jgi:hypothetical protein